MKDRDAKLLEEAYNTIRGFKDPSTRPSFYDPTAGRNTNIETHVEDVVKPGILADLKNYIKIAAQKGYDVANKEFPIIGSEITMKVESAVDQLQQEDIDPEDFLEDITIDDLEEYIEDLMGAAEAYMREYNDYSPY